MNYFFPKLIQGFSQWGGFIAIALLLTNCNAVLKNPSTQIAANATPNPNITNPDLIQQSWQAYRQRFIQGDGRVIDREAEDRSTSEGQAYAMLRSVLMDDRDMFERVLNWGENNLQRQQPNGQRRDRLWAWKWGKNDQGGWGAIDANFASDGDLDAITALILASRRWNKPEYLDLARSKLQDLWALATVEAGNGKRYFLPGEKRLFQPQPDRVYLNPSYLAPYAFRLFAQVDPAHDWMALVDSSYTVLNQSAEVSQVGLPSDWIVLETASGKFQASQDDKLKSIYGFDAYRVWWRVSLDAIWFKEPRAQQYLQQYLQPLQEKWRSQKSIPAQLDLKGEAIVSYESTAQYAMLYAAFSQIDQETAAEIRQQKLLPTYQAGFWDGDSAYYSQNLVWFGLFSPETVNAWFQF
ncbi:MAG: glycosyl hydrolase [Oscillatoriophycideae cyanobacterium NC_groundwater_1537_Pr4_S-0.65um_50_18]|nr:glycosyl hydrolase [Oscillatoriophycideae cyanobacterium NC_groundwater_1537_Pr4_S-0.65um_50_18]